jgi:HD superfamily phosphohydrolase
MGFFDGIDGIDGIDLSGIVNANNGGKDVVNYKNDINQIKNSVNKSSKGSLVTEKDFAEKNLEAKKSYDILKNKYDIKPLNDVQMLVKHINETKKFINDFKMIKYEEV